MTYGSCLHTWHVSLKPKEKALARYSLYKEAHTLFIKEILQGFWNLNQLGKLLHYLL